jgi:hypothetical protein
VVLIRDPQGISFVGIRDQSGAFFGHIHSVGCCHYASGDFGIYIFGYSMYAHYDIHHPFSTYFSLSQKFYKGKSLVEYPPRYADQTFSNTYSLRV